MENNNEKLIELQKKMESLKQEVKDVKRKAHLSREPGNIRKFGYGLKRIIGNTLGYIPNKIISAGETELKEKEKFEEINKEMKQASENAQREVLKKHTSVQIFEKP